MISGTNLKLGTRNLKLNLIHLPFLPLKANRFHFQKGITMTMAVCFECGEIKFGAFCPCSKCSAIPRTEEELALSLAMTDHYFDLATLDQMGAAVREGKPPHLDPQTREDLINTIRSSGMLQQLQELFKEVPPIGNEDVKPPPRD
jgi:hypothetical protein